MTVDGFGAAIWKKCTQSQGLGVSGGWGGGWDTMEGVGEPRTGIIVIYTQTEHNDHLISPFTQAPMPSDFSCD